MNARVTPTPIEEKPLHPAGLGGGRYACEHPERPVDSAVFLDLRCRGCWLASKATVLHGRDHPRNFRGRYGEDAIRFNLSETVETFASFHGFAS